MPAAELKVRSSRPLWRDVLVQVISFTLRRTVWIFARRFGAPRKPVHALDNQVPGERGIQASDSPAEVDYANKWSLLVKPRLSGAGLLNFSGSYANVIQRPGGSYRADIN